MREVTVPLLDLKLQYAAIKTEIDEAIRRGSQQDLVANTLVEFVGRHACV